MFTIRFMPTVFLGYRLATAEAATVQQLVSLADQVAPGGCGVLDSEWAAQDGRYVINLHDWCDCWFDAPAPVLAQIIAPPDFRP